MILTLLVLFLFLLVFGPAMSLLSPGQFWLLLLIAGTWLALALAISNSPRR